MSDLNASAVGRQVKAARLAAGIKTRAELARRIGNDPRNVYRIETGASLPSMPTLVAIARETQQPLEYFVPAEV